MFNMVLEDSSWLPIPGKVERRLATSSPQVAPAQNDNRKTLCSLLRRGQPFEKGLARPAARYPSCGGIKR